MGQRAQRQLVGMAAETRDFSDTGRRNTRLMTKRLSGLGVRNVNFDGGDLCALYSIVQRVRRVGKRTRVDGDGRKTVSVRCTDPIDQLAFVVGLPTGHSQAEFLAPGNQCLVDFRQRGRAINFRLPLTQSVQIRSIENQNSGSRNPCLGFGG